MSEFKHYPVMLNECIEALNIKEDGIYLDGTLGGGGHSLEIAKRLNNGKLYAIDRDEEAIAAASKRLELYKDKIVFTNDNFENADIILESNGVDGIDGALFDLGVSSYQLDTAERGFSYHMDAPLDMRMNKNDSLRAFDVINTYSAQELKRILFEYGEEKFSQPIVNAIIKRRSVSPIQTTLELAELIKEAFPKNARFEGKHPARRTFQAIRIEVNRELEIIRPTILKIVDKLNKGGRLAVITFHSLEDRIVKTTFNSLIDGCTCPKDFPVCVCGYKQKVKQVYKKPIIATEKELSENSRSRSAKLRVIEKI